MTVFAHFGRSVALVLLFSATVLLPRPVEAQPVLSVSPTSVAVQANTGANATSQTVQVSNAGTRALKWSVVQPGAGWVRVSPTSGTNAGTLTLTFTTSMLAAGLFQTSFLVQSTTGSAITVNVQASMVAVAAPPPPGQLTLTCPANISATSPDGSAVSVTYTVSTSGGQAPVTVTGSPASGSNFPVGTTPVQVTARSNDGQTANCGFSVTVTSSAPPAGDWTFCGSEGGFCAFTGTREVRFGANGAYAYKTLADGTACTNSVFGDPIVGTAKQCHTRATTTALPPPPSPSAVGPQATITCPAGAVDIWPGVTVQNIVNSYGPNTTYCLRAGTHALRSAITPKTGDTFVGEYGAILDGTGWSTTDPNQGAFRAHNQDIDYVTIRNLVIRNMPQKGIHAFYWMSDYWTIEYTEIAFNKDGLQFPNHSVIRNNYIHHNVGSNPVDPNPALRGGAYIGYYARNTTLENNEIAYNGREQKVMESVNVTFRNNFVHHNIGDGIWYDGSNPGALVEGNRVEDNGREGIFFEASHDGILRNNILRRNAVTGVFVSMSQNVQIYNNTIEGNFRAITYFLNCGALPEGRDLKNNSAYNNTIRVGSQSGALASSFSYTAGCTATQVAVYRDGSKNLTFARNTYTVPVLSGWYWDWDGVKQWSQWQALGLDTTSTVR